MIILAYKMQGYFFCFISENETDSFSDDGALENYHVLKSEQELLSTDYLEFGRQSVSLKELSYEKSGDHYVFLNKLSFFESSSSRKYRCSAVVASFRLRCRMKLHEEIRGVNLTLEDHTRSFCKYMFCDEFSIWLYNELTSTFTLLCSSLPPSVEYIRKDDQTSLNESLSESFSFVTRAPLESDLALFTRNGMKSLTRTKLRFGPDQQVAVVSFYSKLEGFYAQRDTIDDLQFFLPMKYLDGLQKTERGLDNVIHALRSASDSNVTEYLKVLINSVAENLGYEGASALISDKQTKNLKLFTTVDRRGSFDIKPEIEYPNELELSLTNHTKRDPKAIFIEYDLENTRYNSHTYDEETLHDGKTWVGIPLESDSHLVGVVRFKNKFTLGSDSNPVLVAPNPTDYSALTTIKLIAESHISNYLKLMELEKQHASHENFSSVFRHEIRGPVGSIAEIPDDIINLIKSEPFTSRKREEAVQQLVDLKALASIAVYITQGSNIEDLLSDGILPRLERIGVLADLLIPIHYLTSNYYKKRYYSDLDVRHSDFRGSSVMGDTNLYNMVLYALLDNAGKYQESQSGSIRVYGKYDYKSDLLFMYIENDGIEIKENEQQSIFFREHRGNVAKEQRIDGSGIGLWMAQTIMLKLGGNLELVSRYKPVKFKLTFRTARK